MTQKPVKIFSNWFDKCGDVDGNDLTDIPDDIKVKLLLQRLRLGENERFKCDINPRTISYSKFD